MVVMNKVHSKALLQNTLEHTLLRKIHSRKQYVTYTLMSHLYGTHLDEH